MNNYDDQRMQALIREAERNRRENPAVAEDARYAPSTWSEADTSALMLKLHGTEAGRLDRLISEANERNRRT